MELHHGKRAFIVRFSMRIQYGSDFQPSVSYQLSLSINMSLTIFDIFYENHCQF